MLCSFTLFGPALYAAKMSSRFPWKVSSRKLQVLLAPDIIVRSNGSYTLIFRAVSEELHETLGLPLVTLLEG